MNQDKDYQQDLASIRNLMERSVKFISLSGLSGILAGTYALIGAAFAYFTIQYPLSIISYRQESIQQSDVIIKLLFIAFLVLAASLITGFWLSARKAKQLGTTVWNETSKRLVINLLVPLVTGGLFILILLYYGHYGVVAPACLIFYGLALIHASANLYEEIRYLGYSEIILGLIAAALSGYGLLFWTIGFGILHIFYGALMYRKYDR
jgi:hypothetical protein